ncbi:MAG: DNA/RNA helicase domain-containing protein [Myxococcota bacterium]
MIVYSEPKSRFQADVAANRVSNRISKLLREKVGQRVGASEERSWQNSLLYMRNVLDDDDIPDDAQVSLEYKIPLTSMRIDVIVSGQDAERRDTAVIVELKQWEIVEKTSKDAIVSTFLGGGKRETNHPSYQAWNYAALLRDFSETVQTEDIDLRPCAYLHNCTTPDTVLDPFYAKHLERAPAFLRSDAERLQEFIKRYVKHGDERDLIFRIDRGRIRPSKALADVLVSMLEGNEEFRLIDEQKLVFETALSLVDEGKADRKRVLIVEGGPGTGKSVVAIQLLVELTARGLLTQYVSRNAAPRDVYQAKLSGTFTRTRISNLFRGSGAFMDVESDTFDALIVDEAHRLNEKSGFYGNLGSNQVMELIDAARTTVFFIDEDQRVTIKDIGTKKQIREWAEELGAEVTELELASQFRCNGSDGYLGWIDHALQIRETANTDLGGLDYEFRVCDSPSELRDLVLERNQDTNKARLVAGYCWDWKSKKDPSAFDIEFPGTDFRMRWNLDTDGNLWIMMPESVNEVGCIHTCQGLELDYVGVIIGDDLVVRDGEVVTDASQRARRDKSVHGLKKLARQDAAEAERVADRVIKNTYRTLMTRGQKGCFVYCTDPETLEYFRAFASGATTTVPEPKDRYDGLHLELVDTSEVEPYVNAVPVVDFRIAAGGFSDLQAVTETDWVRLPDDFAVREGMFVAQVVGESMNRRIPNGAWCLFRSDPGGTRNGKVVVVQHRDIQDADLGGQLTVKRYESTRIELDDGSWRHERIVLTPESSIEGYREIVFEEEAAVDLEVIGVLVAVLD